MDFFVVAAHTLNATRKLFSLLFERKSELLHRARCQSQIGI